jgi:hypothetical protein
MPDTSEEITEVNADMIDSLVNCLVGVYPVGPYIDGQPEFGYRQFGQDTNPKELGYISPINKEAAAMIDTLWELLNASSRNG